MPSQVQLYLLYFNLGDDVGNKMGYRTFSMTFKPMDLLNFMKLEEITEKRALVGIRHFSRKIDQGNSLFLDLSNMREYSTHHTRSVRYDGKRFVFLGKQYYANINIEQGCLGNSVNVYVSLPKKKAFRLFNELMEGLNPTLSEHVIKSYDRLPAEIKEQTRLNN